MRNQQGTKVATEFENAPTDAAIPAPLEDAPTRPGWFVGRRNRGLSLAPNDRRLIRQVINYVGSNPNGCRAANVARAMRTILNHYANPADLRETVLAFLQDEAVRLDAADHHTERKS